MRSLEQNKDDWYFVVKSFLSRDVEPSVHVFCIKVTSTTSLQTFKQIK